jgi:hypothetical protein
MPTVKKSAFPCPVCGNPTGVLRTRGDGRGRLIRYRGCTADKSHRVTTREAAIVTTNNTQVRLALINIVKAAGIDPAGLTGSEVTTDNSTHGDQTNASRSEN